MARNIKCRKCDFEYTCEMVSSECTGPTIGGVKCTKQSQWRKAWLERKKSLHVCSQAHKNAHCYGCEYSIPFMSDGSQVKCSPESKNQMLAYRPVIPCRTEEQPKKDNGPKTAPKNAQKDGKPRVSVLPLDIMLKYLVPAYQEGVEKYARESWRDGFKVSDLVDSTLRHLIAFFWGCEDIDLDSQTKKHHLSGAIFSLLSILHTLDKRPDLDDRGELFKNDKF